jgi:hypothetical protein
MPPPSKFVVVHNLPVQHPHLLNPTAEAKTLDSYSSFVGVFILRTIILSVRTILT